MSVRPSVTLFLPIISQPSKVEPSSGVAPGMSQKKKLLVKAHSDWIITEPKTEPEESSKYPTEGSVEKNKPVRYPSSRTLWYGGYEYLDSQEAQ